MSAVLWIWRTNLRGLEKSCGEKGRHGHSLSERAPWPLPGQAFIAFLGTLHQGRSSFIMHRFVLGDYLLQITKKRILQMQGKKWLNWLHSVFGRFSTDFRKLLQRHALNLCYLNSGWGSFSKSKPQSRLDIMQPCFPTGELIPGLVPVGLGCICHCYAGRFPVYI